MSINFENAMFVINYAAGTVEEGLIGYQECSGHCEFHILDADTDEKLGTAFIDMECSGMEATGYDGQTIFSIEDNDREEMFRAVFNSANGKVGYERFIRSIAFATCKNKVGTKELLANAGEAIGRNTKVHKATWNFGKC